MNKTIYTGIARAVWVNLVTPQAPQNGQGAPKYGLTLLFPKNGVCSVTGAQTSTINTVQDALNEVAQSEWKLTPEMAVSQLGIPNAFRIKDGDVDFMKKDKSTGLPLNPPQVMDGFAGNWVMSFRNADEVGTAQPSAVAGVNENIEPSEVYGGCWVKCQVEMAAYKSAHGFVLSGKLLNVLKAYDDSPLGGGKTIAQSADSAFDGMVIEGTNIQAGKGVVSAGAAGAFNQKPELVAKAGSAHTIESLRAAGWTDNAMVEAGHAEWVQPTPPPAPQTPATPTPPPTPAPQTPAAPPAPAAGLTMTATSPNTYDELKAAGWTDDAMVNAGYAVARATQTPTPPPAPATPTPPPAPQTPATPTPPPAPAPAPAPTPQAPAGELTMTATAPNTYAELKAAGWTDQAMVNAGYAEAPNFRDPAGTPPPPPPAA